MNKIFPESAVLGIIRVAYINAKEQLGSDLESMCVTGGLTERPDVMQ